MQLCKADVPQVKSLDLVEPPSHQPTSQSRSSAPHSPDLFKYRLVNSRLINSTFLHNKEGCLLSDVSDENNAYMVYFVSFLGTLAVLPGNIVSALLMDKIGRLRMLGKGSRHSREFSRCQGKRSIVHNVK